MSEPTITDFFAARGRLGGCVHMTVRTPDATYTVPRDAIAVTLTDTDEETGRAVEFAREVVTLDQFGALVASAAGGVMLDAVILREMLVDLTDARDALKPHFGPADAPSPDGATYDTLPRAPVADLSNAALRLRDYLAGALGGMEAVRAADLERFEAEQARA